MIMITIFFTPHSVQMITNYNLDNSYNYTRMTRWLIIVLSWTSQ
jgi:hypothetical protein